MAADQLRKKWGTVFMGEREASEAQLDALQEPALRQRRRQQQEEDYLARVRARAEELGYEFFEMSAVTHEGTRELIKECARRLAELPPIASYEADYVPPEPVIDTSEELEIRQFDDMWIVEGPWLQRLVATINFGDYESRMYFDKVLREAGVFERMEKMGVRDGDTVSMYDLMFEYKD